MRHDITLETKEAIVKQALNREGRSLLEIAAKNKIGYSTLQKWLRDMRAGIPLSSKSGGTGQRHGLEEHLGHLLATTNLDEKAVSIYCRERGIYSHQLMSWKEEIMLGLNSKKQAQHLKELQLLQLENKALKKDLQRKERALAETSTLLILKKKADLIWGKAEDA